MERITSRLLPSVLALAFLAPGQLIQEAAGAGTLARAASEGSAYSASWRITGPTGGDVRALVVDPNDPERFYFGTLDGQLYTSTDAGHNWRLLTNFNRPNLFVDHIIVDPRNSKVLYVAAHRHKVPGGFFKSTDGGLTWREAPELRNEALHSLTQSELNPSVLLAGTITGIFRSQDSGETWSPLPTSRTPDLIDVESLAIDPRSANVIYAGTWHLPYKSTDGGQNWRIINKGIIDDSDIFAINIDPRNADHVIMSACSGIYETRDAGENWSKVKGIPSQSRRTRAILQHPSVPGLVFAGTTEGFWRSAKGGDNNSWMVTTSRQIEINSIAVHPRNPNTIYIGTNNYGVMVSTDGGKNFVPSNNGYSGRFVNSIVPDRETAGRIYATTINTATGGGFFFVSSDGGATWSPSMRNMPPRLMGYSILQDESNGNVIYLGTNLGMYRSVDRGASWAPMSARKLPAPAPARKRPGRAGARRSGAQANTTAPAGNRGTSTAAVRPTVKLMAGDVVRRAQEALERAGYEIGVSDGQLGPRTVAAIGRFQSDRYLPSTGQLDNATLAALGVNGNSTAASVAVRVPSISDPINAIVQFRDHSGHPGVLAATNNGLYRALDPAQGWDRISYGRGLDPRTTSISTSAQNPSVIFVGTATSGVLVSRDTGETWQQVSGVPATSPVNSIVQDQQRSAFIYVGTKQAFYLSHDGGDHWSRRGGNLPFGDFTSILINPRNGNEIFVGNAYQNDQNAELGGGVYRSADGGTTWARIDSREHRLPSMRIWALALDTRDQNTLFVGSHSAGVYVVARGNEASLNSIP
ncbi:MAG TPA: YCF48-related protein [Pyrinomonadaceae bacterium]|nr:YCF48-related protein [Pyrinomonadaceae bacterium]